VCSSDLTDDVIGSFVPVWDQWQWVGKGTKRPGRKGRARKLYYKAIQRGEEILKLGDSAVFVSTGQSTLQYIGRVECLYETWDGNMMVNVKWFYHPEETKGGKKLAELKGALYQSPHEDENEVQTISHKCRVLSYTDYQAELRTRQTIAMTTKNTNKKQRQAPRDDVFYLAGTYEPIIGMITFEPDVKLLH